MGLFSRKDWNVVAVIFERPDLFQLNGQRVKGGAADKAKDGAKGHPRSIFWAVFDQKGSLLESGPGPAAKQVGTDTLKRLERDFRTNRLLLDVLKNLETGAHERVARQMAWTAPAKRPE